MRICSGQARRRTAWLPWCTGPSGSSQPVDRRALGAPPAGRSGRCLPTLPPRSRFRRSNKVSSPNGSAALAGFGTASVPACKLALALRVAIWPVVSGTVGKLLSRVILPALVIIAPGRAWRVNAR